VSDPPIRDRTKISRIGEQRWPMAAAVLSAGALRAVLPPQLRLGDGPWLLAALLVVLLGVLLVGDPGRIDRQSRWLQVTTGTLIGCITVANTSSAVLLVRAIIRVAPFTNNADVLLASGAAVWFGNVIAFALWYWDLDRGGPAARAAGTVHRPGFVFPEMQHVEFVGAAWYPIFVDYFAYAFATSTAFSPTDVSAVRPWSKLLQVLQESVSLVVSLLVVARAVNILK
jgi:hypothetical protein